MAPISTYSSALTEAFTDGNNLFRASRLFSLSQLILRKTSFVPRPYLEKRKAAKGNSTSWPKNGGLWKLSWMPLGKERNSFVFSTMDFKLGSFNCMSKVPFGDAIFLFHSGLFMCSLEMDNGGGKSMFGTSLPVKCLMIDNISI